MSQQEQPITISTDQKAAQPAQRWYYIQFRASEQIHTASAQIQTLKRDEQVMISTDHGLEPAKVTGLGPQPLLEGALAGVQPTLLIQRRCNQDEQEKYDRLIEREINAFQNCQLMIARHKLAMKLIKVERFFNGSKIIFYFTADNRVDFRALVKDLVQEFRTRVEMRQVGVRHETKMIGGIGCCGRELCCSSFIDNFAPVSIKMAKEQHLPLNPTKISGICNRLLCCLTYEFPTYRRIRKEMPRCGKSILVDGTNWKVIKHNILSESVTVVDPKNRETICDLTRAQWEPAMQKDAKQPRPAPLKAKPKRTKPHKARKHSTPSAYPTRNMNTYITTPIFYVNAQPHLGHAYSTIVADTYARYKRLCGNMVRFQTGTDEHGDKIAQAAEGGNESPRQYVDRISAMFADAWPLLTIAPDNFIRTTDEDHIKTVQEILQKVYDQGDIYFSEYEGLYCKGCERFLTEKELVDGKCPDHLCAPERISEQNYFFRMSKYQEWLIDHINSNPDFITPPRYANEMLAFLSEPLEDLCISRPTSRLTWGIPLPFDNNFVTYVWFDALINYLTGLGYPDDEKFKQFWPVAEHVIAKDILKPHAIFWPTMLKSMGLPPFKKLHVHGYWNMGENKMSKSLGNVVRPKDMAAQFGVDVMRYFLLRDMSFGLDSGYTDEAVVARQNSDLANDLGNLFSRSLTMVGKFMDGKVPAPNALRPIDQEMIEASTEMIESYTQEMDIFRFNRALEAVWKVVGLANKYIVENAPWEMAKDEENKRYMATVFHTLLETLRLLALVVEPIMPTTAAKMNKALGVVPEGTLASRSAWGQLLPGTAIAKPEPLFPRMEKKKASQDTPQPAKAKKKGKGDKKRKEELPEGLISFEDFGKVELRVAEIITAEKVEKSDRLLKLTVKAPEERTIVAGIAEFYQPEDIIGKQVIIVANLKPAKLMGITSQGMVLAAKDGDRLILTTVSQTTNPGAKVA